MTDDTTITADDLTTEDIGRLINDLYEIRARFGRYEDDYRQAKVDIAIHQLEEIAELISELQAAGEWDDPSLYGVTHTNEHPVEHVPQQVQDRNHE